MASGLEANNSASINREVLDPANANKAIMDTNSSDSNNRNNSSTNSDYEDDNGEWELAGAKSIMKKSNTQTFTTKSSSNRRRRRLNSGSASSGSNQRTVPKSATTPVLTKSKSNHVELTNLVSDSSTSVQVSKY